MNFIKEEKKVDDKSLKWRDLTTRQTTVRHKMNKTKREVSDHKRQINRNVLHLEKVRHLFSSTYYEYNDYIFQNNIKCCRNRRLSKCTQTGAEDASQGLQSIEKLLE